MIKRILDISLSFIGLFVTLPLTLPVFTILSISNHGKPFFLQIRPGHYNKLFKVIKFRTMKNLYDTEGKLVPDMDRLTIPGRFVRSTSLDEIPQLINVLKGDMSLVGPRPLLPDYLPLYSSEQQRRHNVRPGITGWAQINGRNALTWEQKFELDIWYVDNVSFLLDVKIITLTIWKVLKRDGINSGKESTMEKFMGSSKKF